MNQILHKFQESSVSGLFHSFTPASKAVILFAIPFTVVDAIHYYTAGSALIFSLPLLVLMYLLCGAVAARIAYIEDPDADKLPQVGRSAGFRLWLTSTVINTLLSIILGFASLGITVVGGVFYLCLFAPVHALGSALVAWLGAWLYHQYIQRTSIT